MPSSLHAETCNESVDDGLRRLTHVNAVEGKELYEWLGGAIRVVESTTTAGLLVAVKSREPRSISRSDADMSRQISFFKCSSVRSRFQ